MLKEKKIIGRVETVALPAISAQGVHARIDTGAKTSAIWGEASEKDGVLRVIFKAFDTDVSHDFHAYDTVVVASSNGHMQQRYRVKIGIRLKGRRIRATFTIADRSQQVYPILIGRNVLRGKFIVDVHRGKVLKDKETARSLQIQSQERGK